MVKGHIYYVKVCDGGTQAVNTFRSIQGRGLHTPQQSVTDHYVAMGQDRDGQGTLPSYLNNHGSHVRVGDKAAYPYRPPQKLSDEAKPVPQGSNPRNLFEHHSPHRQEYSRTGPNTVEASNRPRQNDHLKSGPTGNVNPIVNIEIISL
jgi:hypothetical protein